MATNFGTVRGAARWLSGGVALAAVLGAAAPAWAQYRAPFALQDDVTSTARHSAPKWRTLTLLIEGSPQPAISGDGA